MTTKSSKYLGKLPVWNLKDLYNSANGKEILNDLKYIEKSAINFEKKYEGKVENLEAGKLYEAIINLEKIDEKMSKIICYASLLHSENIENEKNRIFFPYGFR